MAWTLRHSLPDVQQFRDKVASWGVERLEGHKTILFKHINCGKESETANDIRKRYYFAILFIRRWAEFPFDKYNTHQKGRNQEINYTSVKLKF